MRLIALTHHHHHHRYHHQFFKGREAIRAFLRRKWAKELDYALMKAGNEAWVDIRGHRLSPHLTSTQSHNTYTQELWAYMDNRIAVRFEYEWRDAQGQW